MKIKSKIYKYINYAKLKMQTLEEEVLEIFDEVKGNVKISYPSKGLKLNKRKIYLLVEKIQQVKVEKDFLLIPKIIAYGQIVDKNNNPLLAKNWYQLSKNVLTELCHVCYKNLD